MAGCVLRPAVKLFCTKFLELRKLRVSGHQGSHEISKCLAFATSLGRLGGISTKGLQEVLRASFLTETCMNKYIEIHINTQAAYIYIYIYIYSYIHIYICHIHI